MDEVEPSQEGHLSFEKYDAVGYWSYSSAQTDHLLQVRLLLCREFHCEMDHKNWLLASWLSSLDMSLRNNGT
jgi:hypothetical protein